MKIISTTELLDSYDGRIEDIKTKIIEVNGTLSEAIQQARKEMIERMEYDIDTEDEEEVNELIDEYRPVMPNEDRLWGRVSDINFRWRLTVTIVQE